MSASAGELNALATATIIDFYRRHFVTDATDRHYLRVSKLATIGWGLFASVVAMYAANQGSLIEVVNRYGSFFYGSLLGVFILAIMTKRATAAGAFWGLIAGMVVVLIVAFTTPIAFLWHNLVGAVVVVVVGMAISLLQTRRATGAPAGAERESRGPVSDGERGSAGAKPPGSNQKLFWMRPRSGRLVTKVRRAASDVLTGRFEAKLRY
jgi:Na+/proline symporter